MFTQSRTNTFKLTVENIEDISESRSSLKRTSKYQKGIDIDKKRVSFDVNNIK